VHRDGVVLVININLVGTVVVPGPAGGPGNHWHDFKSEFEPPGPCVQVPGSSTGPS
jgi:hypothetical protein